MWKENFIWKSITESFLMNFLAFASWWKEEKKLKEIFNEIFNFSHSSEISFQNIH